MFEGGRNAHMRVGVQLPAAIGGSEKPQEQHLQPGSIAGPVLLPVHKT